MRASAASHGKKVSSTYTRYACGTFLPNSLHLLRLFAKVLILYNRHGWRWFHANAMFWALLKTRSQRLYTDVQSLTVDKNRIFIFSVWSTHSHPLTCHIILQLPQFCKSCFFYLTAGGAKSAKGFKGVFVRHPFIILCEVERSSTLCGRCGFLNLLRLFLKRLFKNCRASAVFPNGWHYYQKNTKIASIKL